jgi:phospholipid/cholesterol/gamma-HCH transport system permease protein
VISSSTVARPVNAVGSFFAMALDTLVLIVRPPFAWREFLLQSWFVARVSILPTLMLSIPFTVLLVFTFNILLTEFGAADFSGTGAAFGTVTQIGPIVTVLVVAGAGATAMCACSVPWLCWSAWPEHSASRCSFSTSPRAPSWPA